MGYRSDVGLVIHNNYKKHLQNNSQILQVLNWAEVILEKSDCTLYYWEYIKWYSDESPFYDLMQYLIDSVGEQDYFFCRMGEDPSDKEEYGVWFENPFHMGLVRHIGFDQPSKKVINLKHLNTQPEAITCAQCGAVLKDPMPGIPSMKHCPICEP